MSKLILNAKYIKPGEHNKKYNLIEYVATRMGVEKVPYPEQQENLSGNATSEQKKYISKLVRLLPETKQLIEYADYKASPTKENAAHLLDSIIQNNYDLVDTDKFISYLAYRPRAERQDCGHGLFTTGDKAVDLSEVKKEIAELKTNLYTTVISLRREDAARLCYENAAAWKQIVEANQYKIAESFKIKPQDLRWYAAFHNEGHHPHIHLMVYSAGQEGYLSKKGIENLKGAIATDIFKNDLYDIYAGQKETIAKSKQAVKTVLSDLTGKDEIADKLKALADSLKDYSGRKSYGYLSRGCKRAVDDILKLIAENHDVHSAYEKYKELRTEQLLLYHTTDTMPDIPELTENKEFKVLKNMVVKEAFALRDELQKSGQGVSSEQDSTQTTVETSASDNLSKTALGGTAAIDSFDKEEAENTENKEKSKNDSDKHLTSSVILLLTSVLSSINGTTDSNGNSANNQDKKLRKQRGEKFDDEHYHEL